MSFDVRPVLGEPDFLNPGLSTYVPKPMSSVGQNRPMFRGPSWGDRSASRFAHQVPKNPGAASRERQFPLPAPLPDWPRTKPRFHPLPAGGDRFFCPFLALLAVAGFPERLGHPPRSLGHHAHRRRVAEAKFSVTSLWITGISGTTIGTFGDRPIELPIRSHFPTSIKCLNRQH